MLSSKVLQALEMFDQQAAKHGYPRYESLESELQAARARGDVRAAADLAQQIGLRLSSIATVALALGGREPDAGMFPTPAEALNPAIELFRDSLETADAIDDDHLRKFALTRLGDCYLQLSRYDEALVHLERVRELCRMPEDAALGFDTSQKAGDCYLNLEDDEKALARYQDAMEIARAIDDPFEVSTQFGKIASALGNLKRYDEALNQYEQARDLSIRLANEEGLRAKVQLHRNTFTAAALPNIVAHIEELIAATREKKRYHDAIAAMPTASAVRYRHANHYLQRLDAINQAHKSSSDEDLASVAASFEREWWQIRVGQDWAANHRAESEIFVRLTIDYGSTASLFLDDRVSALERLRWTEPALAAAEAQRAAGAQIGLLTDIGYTCKDLGRTDEALHHLEQALRLSRKMNDQRAEGRALIALGALYDRLGRYTEALQAVERGISLTRDPETGTEKNTPQLGNLMGIYLSTGNYPQALQAGERDLAIARSSHDSSREAKALGNFGRAYHQLGKYQDALDHYLGALAIARKIGERRAELIDLMGAASAYLELEQFQPSETLYLEALKLSREFDNREVEEGCLGNLGNLYRTMGRYDAAVDHYEQAQTIARKSGHRAGEAMALGGLGNVAVKRREYDTAVDLFEKALAVEREIGRSESQSVVLLNLGQAYLLMENFADALKRFDEALELATALGNKFIEGRVRHARSIGLGMAGRRIEALPEALRARDIFKELGSPSNIEAAELTISQFAAFEDADSPAATDADVLRLVHRWTRIPAVDTADSKAFLIEHGDKLMSDKGERLLQVLLRSAPDDATLRRHSELLRECRSDGVEAAYQRYSLEILAALTKAWDQWRGTPESERVLGKIVEWAQQPDKLSSRRFLEANKDELLSVYAWLTLVLLVKEDKGVWGDLRELLELALPLPRKWFGTNLI